MSWAPASIALRLLSLFLLLPPALAGDSFAQATLANRSGAVDAQTCHLAEFGDLGLCEQAGRRMDAYADVEPLRWLKEERAHLDPETAQVFQEMDWGIALSLGSAIMAAVAAYLVIPREGCDEDAARPCSFWQYALGCGCWQRWSLKDAHLAAGLHSLKALFSSNANLASDAAESLHMSVRAGESLEGALWRQALPYWTVTNIIYIAHLLVILHVHAAVPAVFSLWALTDEELCGSILLEMQAASCLAWISRAIMDGLGKSIFLCCAVSPFFQVVELMLVKQSANIHPEAAATINGKEVRALSTKLHEITAILSEGPQRHILAEAIMLPFMLYKLYSSHGLVVILLGIMVLSLGAALSKEAVAYGKRLEPERARLLAVYQRTHAFIASNFKALRPSRALKSASREIGPEGNQHVSNHLVKMSFLPGLLPLLAQQFDTLVLLVLYGVGTVFHGVKMPIHEVFRSKVYLYQVFTLGSHLRTVLRDVQSLRMRLTLIEEYIRTAEACKDLKRGNPKLEGASFALPVSTSSADESARSSAILHDLDLEVGKGELVLICGATGSGKSSLLASMLGELRLTSGQQRCPELPVAFQMQAPLLLNGTVEDNILLKDVAGTDTQKCFLKALSAVQLDFDMETRRNPLYAKKHYTEVGEGGAALSKGQRHRIALGRVCYQVLQGAETVFLDDPFAEVNSDEISEIWQSTVLGVMKGCTRVVAVNSQLLERLAPTADRLVVLKDGRAVYIGPVHEVAQASDIINDALGGDYKIATHCDGEDARGADGAGAVQAPEVETQLDDSDDDPASALAGMIQHCPPLRGFVRGKESSLKLSHRDSGRFRELLQDLARPLPTSMCDDHQSEEALSIMQIITDVISLKTALLLAVGSFALKLRMAVFHEEVEHWHHAHGEDSYYLVRFLSLCIAFLGLTTLLEYCGVKMRVGVLQSLLDEMHIAINKLPMGIMWSNPKETLRAWKAVEALDWLSLMLIVKMPVEVAKLAISVLYVAIQAPYVVLITLASVPVQAKLTELGVWASQQEAVRHSIARGQEELAGSCFEHRLVLRAGLAQDFYARKAFAGSTAMFRIRDWQNQASQFKAIIKQILAFIVAIAVVSVLRHMKTAGEAGLAIWIVAAVAAGLADQTTGLIEMWPIFLKAIQQYRAFARIAKISLLEDEMEGKALPTSWPSVGKLTFEKVCFRYRPEGPKALQGLSLEIQGGEKLGVFDLAHGGKSALVAVLLRLGPMEHGRVLIDEIDISSLRCSDLRSMVGLVPNQVAILSSSLKDNVCAESSDAEVLVALQRVGLDAKRLTSKDTLPGALASPMDAGQISRGEAQLLGLARALVRHPKVLILDDCIAALSRDQADQMMECLQAHHKETTVLSIASTTRDLLKFDRILIMQDGAVKTIDTPAALLEDSEGYLAAIVRSEQQEEL